MTVGTKAPSALEDVLPPPVDLPPEAAGILLRLARAVVGAAASHRWRAPELAGLLPPDPPAALLAPRAAFVTLHKDGELRGCMGTLVAETSLWQAVISAAVGAAARDPRFLPVTTGELPFLAIDVSVLGPAVPLRDPTAFRPGVDGLIVERGGRTGLLLPEVALDQGWGAFEMLEGTCWKAGLPVDAWRDPATTVLAFRTARVSDRPGGDPSDAA